MTNKIMIIAGEASGDLHGAALIKELLNINPKIKFYGIGGDKMVAEGLIAQYHIKQMSFLGFVEVLKHIPFIKAVQKTLINKIKEENIHTAILIDYPGFNLNFAKKIKEMGVKIIYYISPQVWAWGKKRVNKIKQLIDKMIVVFPFEVNFYREHNFKVDYTGHPLIDRINNYKFLTRTELITKFNLEENKDILLVMPGSRQQEIKKIFPAVITAAEKLAKDFNLQIVIACSENIEVSVFNKFTSSSNYHLVRGNTYDLIKYSKFGIIKSGTSTLEAALLQLPFIVVYKTSVFSYIIGKLLASIKTIAMPNIIAGEKIVEELIQKDVTTDKIYRKSKILLKDEILYNNLKNKLGSIKEKLGDGNASKKAAELIITELNEH
ncbi:lipid-A-disaccharide synthase [Melioribacteraceae bacterium 4301-Me]|uniref:lipid-A-disaccharide synthase n=1 Tax=Pyranulibacter aquaticus TaxID=3163344 RepID=UPI00359AECF3